MRIYCYNRLHFVAPSFIILHTLKIFTASIINQLRIKSKSEWSKKSLLAWTTLRFTSFSLWDIVKDHYRCNKSSNGKCLLYVCNLFSLSLYMHTQVFLLTATANPYLSPPELTTWIIVCSLTFSLNSYVAGIHVSFKSFFSQIPLEMEVEIEKK